MMKLNTVTKQKIKTILNNQICHLKIYQTKQYYEQTYGGKDGK